LKAARSLDCGRLFFHRKGWHNSPASPKGKLRADINQGLEDIQLGRSITLSSDEEVDQFISQIMGSGR
jgi:hypothetical protein